MGLASPVESLPVNGAEVRVTDDESVDAAASRDMDFKLRSTRGIMSSIIRDRTKSVPTGPLWSYFFMSGWLQFFTGSVGC